ncbi:hypothetical protein K501DRAFT_274288 [Backusella circina FSU 941]|nr:hypothetical protein K501DRAFT_274288 [Backusella circina FSU 941]
MQKARTKHLKINAFFSNIGSSLDIVMNSTLVAVYWKQANSAKDALIAAAKQAEMNAKLYDNSIDLAQNTLTRQASGGSETSQSSETALVSSQESSEKHPKRQYCYSFCDFKNVELTSHESWIVNDVNVTSELFYFRNISVMCVDKNKGISNVRSMSIGHIYYLSHANRTESVINHLPRSISKSVYSAFDSKYRGDSIEICAKLLKWCFDLAGGQ